MRKGKKMLIIVLISILVVIAAIFVIKTIVDKTPSQEEPEQGSSVISLPETTYSDMEVKNVQMEYLKNNNETMVSMEIHNTTANSVSNESLDAVLIGPNDEILGQLQTYIKQLNPGEQYDISVILKGDLTATTQIKLIKK